MNVLVVVSLAFLSVGCSAKTIYLAPAITGQLLDEKTNQPIVNKGNIFTMIKEDGSNVAKTDNNGRFYVEAIESKPISESIYRSRPTTVTFNVEGYKIERINYNGYELTPKTNSREVKTTVELGEVYLKRK